MYIHNLTLFDQRISHGPPVCITVEHFMPKAKISFEIIWFLEFRNHSIQEVFAYATRAMIIYFAVSHLGIGHAVLSTFQQSPLLLLIFEESKRKMRNCLHYVAARRPWFQCRVVFFFSFDILQTLTTRSSDQKIPSKIHSRIGRFAQTIKIVAHGMFKSARIQ